MRCAICNREGATCGRSECVAALSRPRQPAESPYQYANRQGQAAATNNGSWRDNPFTPGTREYFEFNDGPEQMKRLPKIGDNVTTVGKSPFRGRSQRPRR